MNKYSKINNIFAYLLGYYRYHIYYSKKYKWMIRLHIFEQIQYRILVMDKKCFSRGSCKLCGCSTTALQMANKACDKPCYPKMMGRRKWKFYKIDNDISSKQIMFIGDLKEGKKIVVWEKDFPNEHLYITGFDPYKKEEDE